MSHIKELGFGRGRPRRNPPARKSTEHIGYWYAKDRSTYINHGCRCVDCVAANTEYDRKRRKRAAS